MATTGHQATLSSIPDLATWGLSRGPDDGLLLGTVQLADLVREHGSPLHVVDAGALDRNATAALAPFRAGAGADVFSSYKTNPVPAVLSRLHRNGVGAEAISHYEFWLAIRLGVPPDRIVYNGPAKSPESLEDAARRGIALVNANSRTDLAAMASAARRAGHRMRAGLRVSLPHMWGGQFGVRDQADHVAEAIVDGREATELDLVGLHFHSGLPIATAADLERHLAAVMACCDRIADRTGWHPEVIDLGGSLVCAPVARAGGVEQPLSIADASSAMACQVGDHMVSAGRSMPDLLIEPGRSLTGDAQFLLTTVLDVRAESGSTTIVLDIGTEVAEPMQGEPHSVFAVGSTGPSRPVRLCGPSGRVTETLVGDVALPDVEPGDVLAVMDTGAYFVPFSTATTFGRPAIVMVDGSEVAVIRRRETAEEWDRLDVV